MKPNCGNVLQFKRGHAVCVGYDDKRPMFVFVMPPSDETRHRADITLGLMQHVTSGLHPDSRFRCVIRPISVHGTLVGELGHSAMAAILAGCELEAEAQRFEANNERRRAAV
ncbi:hypothetical protein J2D73_18570 [Acetobacter sacchari]|uniref:Uncharacterized protein n=1 Tax=Acetobacter sacchari TaxID=2661687 RepID=A0ABS3M0Z5_9PROT|nr:hypothetical protein [Acetobacter sacchari]MBO1361790.1 hypothetical protein [Acetobacter sacchari]